MPLAKADGVAVLDAWCAHVFQNGGCCLLWISQKAKQFGGVSGLGRYQQLLNGGACPCQEAKGL
jgi:hypothetical protein